ncbi:MAG: hypothetical protein A2665_01270 [Candidatus Zambryskibacteria bacterium RIFCSPHIGHO2_01_FULL_46_30]|uniref:Phosphoribosylaminoimidazole-succinocarboxamide synthase n=2 Tax=Parcubacteria group TaxID=1794811 RepID=A0A837IK00_9BACT|nr:MAG: Phosphoribosylaminoimidazolesuccinocarboxamidesy nthase [Candidatus Yanofskybacteria bacterium GW2011_GWC1_48_11]OHA90194.1 MAG: hypothetical protein A2665_01270 [Candidatus Zambryskibacteria bacterium RIFCSPHIGHO2_01_FULL_46_30]OHB05617.1 MAG: hypothetical protein A3B22_02505 [Candidatus Zambryskibacteria bacterium RIFCSPLOWO2_01_FULL_47_33]
MSKKGSLLAEGKTKKIWRNALTTSEVLIESKNDVTAGDGARREEFEGKGVYSTTTAVKCFELLTAYGIPNHFIGPLDATTFRARELSMIPTEVVVRRIATGSYLKRRPDVEEGERFKNPLVEFFVKLDAEHDPLMIRDYVSRRVLLYDAKKPLAEGFLREVRPVQSMEESPILDLFITNELVSLAERTFSVLEDAWAAQNVTLVDLKIECGNDVTSGQMVVGDVITNDEWRIWPGGEKSRQLDKQVFREMPEATHEAMKVLKANYAKVAELVGQFKV